MYRLLLFVIVLTAVSCVLVKRIGKRCNVTPRQRFWIGLSIPVVGILIYEWVDHHQELLRRIFGFKSKPAEASPRPRQSAPERS